MSASLIRYAIGVVVALAIMLAVTWALGGEARFKTAVVFGLGFLAGRLSMFIKGRSMGVF
ncbi:MAG: hypothetical protein WBS22_00970 [Methylocystis sp.]